MAAELADRADGRLTTETQCPRPACTGADRGRGLMFLFAAKAAEGDWGLRCRPRTRNNLRCCAAFPGSRVTTVDAMKYLLRPGDGEFAGPHGASHRPETHR
jgi:hypothetical protein